jgi:hypothetical protein
MRVAFSFILIIAASSLFAQSYQTEVEILQAAFGLEKKVAVANFMNLDDSAEGFWKIYDEYEAKRKELGKERINIIAAYAKSYPTISDEEISALFKKTQGVKKSFDKLQNTYFKQMSKAVGVSKAAQFWQLESYFNAMILADIYSQIPFIGENIKDN